MENGPGLAKIATDSQPVDWFKMITKWEKSGLTRKLFCEQYQLDYHQFLYQRAKWNQKNRAPLPSNWLSIPRGENKLIPAPEGVPTAPSPGFLLKTIQGYQLTIPFSADTSTLKTLLSFMKEVSC